tara:strand:- start:62700 stop:63089 length:390 start_codon:yes stop_codon:yes gene_type:complete
MADKAQVSVLVAEDNEVNQKIIAKILSKNGIDYKIVSNGEQAIDMYQIGSYGLILMDCQMPIMDGLVATERIREFEKTNGKGRVPIVALTANAMKGDREKCMERGMDDFLPKPFRMNQLLDLIKHWTTP